MNVKYRAHSGLDALIELFFDNVPVLGEFAHVVGDEIPAPYRQLLDHHEHMTVTLEAHYRSPVNVTVLAAKRVADGYCRNSLLTCQSDGKIVQFGIVRMHSRLLDEPVRSAIEGGKIPLGRVLISHDVLREVQLCDVYRVTCGPELARQFKTDEGTITFGRTALLSCNGRPAFELLEIVAPCSVDCDA